MARWSASWGDGSVVHVPPIYRVLGRVRGKGGPLPICWGQPGGDCDTSRGVSRTGSEGAPALIEGRRPDAPKPPASAAPSKPDVRETVGRWYRACFCFSSRAAGASLAKGRMDRYRGQGEGSRRFRSGKSMKDRVRQGWCANKQRARAGWA